MIHYSKKQKICLIERPKKHPAFSDYLYSANASKPTIYWRKDENGVDNLLVAWFNLIKICKLKIREDTKKYQVEVVKNIDLDNVYICGVT